MVDVGIHKQDLRIDAMKKAIQQQLDNITIIIDTREQSHKHITDYFDRKGIKYIYRSLKFADYSFEVDGKSYENDIAIERKNSLEEISSNFCNKKDKQNRDRFEREFQRAKDVNAKVILMIEDASYKDMVYGNYNTDLKGRSFVASLFSFQHRYDISPIFIDKDCAGNFIYYQFYYWLMERLKSEG